MYWPGRSVDEEMEITDTRCLFESLRFSSGEAPYPKKISVVAQPCDSAGS